MKPSLVLRWLLVALILIGVVGWIVGDSDLYARLIYLSALLLIGTAIWTVLSLRGVRIKREARNLRASMGEIFEERFEVVKSSWPASLWIEVVNLSPLAMASGSRLLTGVGAHQRRFYMARTLLTQRGAFPLGPTEISSGDPFGVFRARRSFPAHDTLIVLPMTVPISSLPIPPGILPGGKTIRSKTQDVTPHAAGVREYVPGDPMKRIHWRSTAHRGRFMVKEFEQDPQAEIWLFLDAQRAVQASAPAEVVSMEDGWLWLRRPKVSLPRDSFEYAVSATASLARYFLAARRAVGLASASGRFTILSAERGERQVGKIMETLAFLQPQGEIPLFGLVTMQAKLIPQGSGVILVTPSVQPDLLLAVEYLLRRNLRPMLVLIKVESFGGMGDNQDIVEKLQQRNVPVCPIGYGEDMAAALSLPAAYFPHFSFPDFRVDRRP
ncbi:MAG: DUF58 domain-containing protein [Anaerolineales bacterium]